MKRKIQSEQLEQALTLLGLLPDAIGIGSLKGDTDILKRCSDNIRLIHLTINHENTVFDTTEDELISSNKIAYEVMQLKIKYHK